MGDLRIGNISEIEREVERLSRETWITKKQAWVVILRNRGFTYSVIADVLDVKRGTVSKRMLQVRNQYDQRRDDLLYVRKRYRSVVDREFKN